MTRPRPQTSAETDPRSGARAPATGDAPKTDSNAADSDTKRGTEPKGHGLGAEPIPGAQRANGGGGSDTGGGGGPKTGLGAQPMTGLAAKPSPPSTEAPDPSPDPKKPPKTGLKAEPIE